MDGQIYEWVNGGWVVDRWVDGRMMGGSVNWCMNQLEVEGETQERTTENTSKRMLTERL